MSDDPKNAIFCQWAGCPGFFPEFGRPFVRAIVLNMCRVNQGDEHIDIGDLPPASPPYLPATNFQPTEMVRDMRGMRGKFAGWRMFASVGVETAPAEETLAADGAHRQELLQSGG
jgi:hypothetical protein